MPSTPEAMGRIRSILPARGRRSSSQGIALDRRKGHRRVVTTTQGAADTDDVAAVLRRAVEAMPHPVAMIDVPTRRVLTVSPVLASWFGGVEVVGHDAGEFIVGRPSEAFRLLAT